MAAISIPDDSDTDADDFKMKSTPKFTVESSLKNHIMEILAALPAAPADRLASIFLSTLGNSQLRVGTLCSGSDSVVDVLQAPESAISTFAPRFWFLVLSNIIDYRSNSPKCQKSLWELFVMDGFFFHRQPYHYVRFAWFEIFCECGRPQMGLGSILNNMPVKLSTIRTGLCTVPLSWLWQVMVEVGKEWASTRLGQGGSALTVSHQFSCELNKQMQKFILASHNPAMLVQNINEMSSSMVEDVKTNQFKPVPHVTIAFCGWMCVDACFGCTELDFSPPVR